MLLEGEIVFGEGYVCIVDGEGDFGFFLEGLCEILGVDGVEVFYDFFGLLFVAGADGGVVGFGDCGHGG